MVSRSARLAALAAACFAVVLILVNATGDSRPAVVADSPAPVEASSNVPVRDGWKTVAYQGVQIDIPNAWERLDMTDCELHFEQWSHRSRRRVVSKEALRSISPQRSTRSTLRASGEPPEVRTPAWNGYVYAGDYAVYAAHSDRDLVQGVLDSARVSRSALSRRPVSRGVTPGRASWSSMTTYTAARELTEELLARCWPACCRGGVRAAEVGRRSSGDPYPPAFV